MMNRPLTVLTRFVALIALTAQGWAGEPDTWASDRGLFRVSFTSSIHPLEINRIHEWVVHVETAAGDVVEGATLQVSGGMPKHDHGLPTSPRVTADLGNGDYRVQGLRFHMTGAWLINITIDDGMHTDQVAIDFVLK